jgi:holin-like protein
MKYIKQFGIILIVSFLGELLCRIIPLPIPASIYGLIIMFTVLQIRLFPVSAVRDTSKFLIEIMPLMFIPAAAGLLKLWEIVKPLLLPYMIITVISTVLVMAVAGQITQTVINYDANNKQKKKKDEIHQ